MNVLQYNKQKKPYRFETAGKGISSYYSVSLQLFATSRSKLIYVRSDYTHGTQRNVEGRFVLPKTVPLGLGRNYNCIFPRLRSRRSRVVFFSFFSRPSRPTHGRFGANSERG